ncbi:hypothetical protein [Sphingosinithalassobacter portus]|uniref:hypothetical protein n=1 Tax=Stakelama portus TaxID=2676234 RepID=UPI0012B61609|nr:hypothetical protein [Sphingosinithalassobacter portus]
MNRRPHPPQDDRKAQLEMQRFVERIGTAVSITLFAITVLAVLKYLGLGIDR